MAYDKQEIFEKAKVVIEEKSLLFIDDVVVFLPCGRSTFYEYFSPNSDEMDTIKELLERNKVNKKIDLRLKWFNSNNATLQMALMKLLSTDEELRRLSMQFVKNENDIKIGVDAEEIEESFV